MSSTGCRRLAVILCALWGCRGTSQQHDAREWPAVVGPRQGHSDWADGALLSCNMQLALALP